jgi:hypothetical protein
VDRLLEKRKINRDFVARFSPLLLNFEELNNITIIINS